MFRRSLKQTNHLQSPLLFSSSHLKPKSVQIGPDIKKSESKCQIIKRRSVLPRPKSVTKDIDTDSKLPATQNDDRSDEKRLDYFAEAFVNDLLKDIQKVSFSYTIRKYSITKINIHVSYI